MNKILEKDIDNFASIECCSCGADVKVWAIKQQMAEGLIWFYISFTGRYLCGYCSKELEIYDAKSDRKFNSYKTEL